MKDLLRGYGIDGSALQDLERLLDALEVYGIDGNRLCLNLGLGRGLQYYTGMIFEIYHEAIRTENQICGGGRYDDLIQALGGHRPVPACGFSYGLERLRLALGREGTLPQTQVLVIAVEEADRREALRLAQELRDLGLRVETDVRDRGVKGNLQYAARSGIPFCLILGASEREAGTVVVRDMGQVKESVVPRGEAGRMDATDGWSASTGRSKVTPTEVRLGLPSKGTLETPTLSFLEACGLRVDKINPRQYTASLPAVPGLVVLFQRVTDIIDKVKDGSVSLGISGYDIVAEMKEEGDPLIALHPALGYGKCELVVAVPEAWIDVLTMDDLADVALSLREKGKVLRVGTKFANLTRDFFRQKGISHYSIIQAEGAIEAGPSIGYADIIVDLTSSGTTLRDNRLKRIEGGDILKSQACLIGNRHALKHIPEALSAAQTILEFIDSYLSAREYCSVFANIYADSADEAAQRILAQPGISGLQRPHDFEGLHRRLGRGPVLCHARDHREGRAVPGSAATAQGRLCQHHRAAGELSVSGYVAQLQASSEPPAARR